MILVLHVIQSLAALACPHMLTPSKCAAAFGKNERPSWRLSAMLVWLEVYYKGLEKIKSI